jgi:hypothetical protein
MNIKRMISYQISLKALGKKDVRGFSSKYFFAGTNSFRFQHNKIHVLWFPDPFCIQRKLGKFPKVLENRGKCSVTVLAFSKLILKILVPPWVCPEFFLTTFRPVGE